METACATSQDRSPTLFIVAPVDNNSLAARNP
jgi:hypothetical protein